jgi:hypothetical protein
MPPPSKLTVATSSLTRLVKEEASYHKEMEQQQARIKKLEAGSDEENAEFMLRQEVLHFNQVQDNDVAKLHLETRPRGDQDGHTDSTCQDQ